ncbi:hypothetical protein ACEWY4_016779 [Coilia grayii]|uniref:DDE-1 domain-containing protein n=1 Tax=Coilia grayii TaxID=363190 RepID=A0ABD1JP38_9TELE
MWWSRFRARHPTVASKRPNYIEAERVHRATVMRVDELFHICQALYDHQGFRGTPELIYNCDETGFGDKGSSRKRVLCDKGQRTLYAQQCLPSTAYCLEGPPNALYGVLDTGYMDCDLFLEWLEHFVRLAQQERSFLLFMDQHEAHIGTGVVDFCRANQIEVVCLPSHTTHVLQPLYVSVYGPLKAAFTNMARCLGLVRGNLTIGKRNFTPVQKVTLEQACNPHNIRSGFLKTGLFPLDRKAVDESKLVKGLHRPSDASSTSPSSTGEDAPTAFTSSSVYTDAANAVPDTVPRSTTVDSTCDVTEDPSTTNSSTVSSHRGPATITTVLTPWGSPASSSSATTTSPASIATIIPAASSSPTIANIAATAASPTPTTAAAASLTTITAAASNNNTTATGQCPTCRRFPNPLVTAVSLRRH